jgi:hypothetical protein
MALRKISRVFGLMTINFGRRRANVGVRTDHKTTCTLCMEHYFVSVVVGFRRGVNYMFALLGC